jgi:hypothetical protein
VATSQQIKTDWLDRARPLGHPDLDEYDRLADQLIADDAVDATCPSASPSRTAPAPPAATPATGC